MISLPRQYKKTAQGNVRVMQVEVDEVDNTYHLITGFLGFKLDYQTVHCVSREHACSEALSLHLEYKGKGFTSVYNEDK